jgi:hypothetical protein
MAGSASSPAAGILPRKWGTSNGGQQDFDFSKRPICQAFGWRRPHRFAVISHHLCRSAPERLGSGAVERDAAWPACHEAEWLGTCSTAT